MATFFACALTWVEERGVRVVWLESYCGVLDMLHLPVLPAVGHQFQVNIARLVPRGKSFLRYRIDLGEGHRPVGSLELLGEVLVQKMTPFRVGIGVLLIGDWWGHLSGAIVAGGVSGTDLDGVGGGHWCETLE